jgi:hypothetical protein
LIARYQRTARKDNQSIRTILDMNRVEVEAVVHRVIADLAAGCPVEVDRIELNRRSSVDFNKTAREVAGHANSAGAGTDPLDHRR